MIKLGEEINFANVTLNFALPETIVSRSLQNLTFALFIYENGRGAACLTNQHKLGTYN